MPPMFLAMPRMIEVIIGRVIEREGGYVNNPDDPGKQTNMGITIKTLTAWREEITSEEDVRSLTREEATQIYFQMYWRQAGLLYLGAWDWWLKEFIFDWCVNAGFKNPIRQIQRIVGAKSDGSIGPKTARSIDLWFRNNGEKSPGYLCDLRIRWYVRLAASRHSRIQFLEGWFNRANNLRYSAHPFSPTQ